MLHKLSVLFSAKLASRTQILHLGVLASGVAGVIGVYYHAWARQVVCLFKFLWVLGAVY